TAVVATRAANSLSSFPRKRESIFTCAGKPLDSGFHRMTTLPIEAARGNAFARPAREPPSTMLSNEALQLRQRSDAALRFLVGDHPAHVGEQFLRVVDDAVLDRVLHAADAMRLAVGTEADMAGAVEHLQIRERVFLEHDEVGELARFDRAEV